MVSREHSTVNDMSDFLNSEVKSYLDESVLSLLAMSAVHRPLN